ncbi:XRE family transcriptional regulator [Corynebacterium sp. sy017]|uniref:helix-turn-helix domain-containing protein n=1 Tax=unclassified Corynebacterium TaxID=2624378 RepID=UPI0011864D17|nr:MULTISPECIES: helix-turn-helix transcriptional regulator [unclassified Corynebacterium]MBP3088695.1 XRE family transcriptional regulator [Corynebacterium sp. sy017]QDZ42096.1 helix-turn-helix transcriptional regulator [Corynebacterium sp. sy039]TSD91983.1 XRE family transcriptional regulator [Corynebacterium sp. SY003]
MTIVDVHWASYGYALGVRLKAIREMRGLSQTKLADLSGLSRTTISIIERNESNSGTATRPTLQTIYTLARVLHVPPAVLLPGVGKTVADVFTEDTPGDLSIEIHWPTQAIDVVAFSPHYIETAYPGQIPEFDQYELEKVEQQHELEAPITDRD